MNVNHSFESDTLHPLHIVMIVLLVAVVGGGCLLLSAPQSDQLMEGAVEWHEGSLLRAVVQVLCLNHQAPTIHAGTVKNYILGMGAGLSIIIFVVAIVVRGQGESYKDEVGEKLSAAGVVSGNSANGNSGHHITVSHRLSSPLVAAQILIALYVLWSFASSRWSPAPIVSVGASAMLAVQILWAFGLGFSLSVQAARLATGIMIAILSVTAALAVWYYYGRNPGLRAMYPFGNPTFLAAVLIPGLVLSVVYIFKTIQRAVHHQTKISVTPLLIMTIALGFMGWTFYLAGSRGAAAGLLFSFLTALFLMFQGRRKWIPIVFAIAIAVGGALYFNSQAQVDSPTGRSTTIRLRSYAWNYAWQMFSERPLAGHGQAGFVLQGDAHAVKDVLNDPQVFESRITHTHNEWLEVMADLGIVGITLIIAGIVITLRAGVITLQTSLPQQDRWMLIGLLSALVGIIVDACFGVGLRITGVPTVFYTLIGLIWAMCSYGRQGIAQVLSVNRPRRIITGVLGFSLGLAAMAIANQDWSAARSAFRAEQAFQKEDPDQAILLATASIGRLNPLRKLTQLYRLGVTHLRAAQFLQSRGLDRHQRSYDTQPPNPRLIALGQQDIQLSDLQCEAASRYVKELVSVSPGFINHGWLEYQINLTRAQNVESFAMMESALAGTPLSKTREVEIKQKKEQFIQNAIKSIERELVRQPFTPTLALNFVHVQLPKFDWQLELDVLARPLRYHTVDKDYLDVLTALIDDSEFITTFEKNVNDILTQASDADTTIDLMALWVPEKLRLWATVLFLRGNYQAAREVLEKIVNIYAQSGASNLMGIADSYDWLATSIFYDHPGSPDEAIQHALMAISSAPQSGPGREFIAATKQRMVNYYLAKNNEQASLQILQETAPVGAMQEIIDHELAARYIQLTQMMMRRRESKALRKPLDEILSNMQRWLTRAMELNDRDPVAYFIAADLAFHNGQHDATASLLELSLERGLPVREAWKFLTIAKQKKPGIASIEALWDKLSKSVQQPAGHNPSQ